MKTLTHTVITDNAEGYCCLGVGCEIFIPKKNQKRNTQGFLIGSWADSQPSAPEWLKTINHDSFVSLTGTTLSTLNDSGIDALGSFSFDEIADLIELVYVHEAL
jgi:hypothetical protein